MKPTQTTQPTGPTSIEYVFNVEQAQAIMLARIHASGGCPDPSSWTPLRLALDDAFVARLRTEDPQTPAEARIYVQLADILRRGRPVNVSTYPDLTEDHHLRSPSAATLALLGQPAAADAPAQGRS